jgi:VWFA-related protein
MGRFRWDPAVKAAVKALYNSRQQAQYLGVRRNDFLKDGTRQMPFFPAPPMWTFSRNLRRIAASLTALVLVAPACLAQNGPGQTESRQTEPAKPAPAQTTVVTVNEVSLNLVVRNKQGKLVTDLKPEDISVSDGGTPVKISTLRLVSGDSGQHIVTLVFDRLGLASGHNAQEIADKILKMVPQNGFSICVMKAEGRLMLYHDYTSDRKGLADAISLATDDEKSAGGKGAEAAEKRIIAIAQTGSDEAGAKVTAQERSMAQVLLASLQESQRVAQELHTQPGLSGLLALARTQQKMPGRKTIIYFAEGLESEATTETRLRDIVGAANRAGVSIYVIDATALTAQADESMVAMMAMGNTRSAQAQAPPHPVTTTGGGGLPQTTPQAPAGLAPMVANQVDRYEAADPNANKSPLIAFAESTGGAYVAPGADMKKPLRRMIEDMTTYYDASYASPIENYDGQFRAIAVQPVRQGLRISSRAGYFALPPASGRTVRPFEAPLLKVLAEEPLPSNVAFHTKVLRLGDLPTGNQNTLVVQVPISAIETWNDPNSNLYSLHITLVAQIKDKSGAVVEHFSEDIPRHGSLSAKDAQPEFITMQRHFTAEPGQYVLEAAVLDQNSGKSGAQRMPFEVPRDPEGPSLSDVAMVQRIDPVPEEADPDEPMRYGNGKVVAGVSDRVMKGTKELSFFFVVHSEGDPDSRPRLEMEVLKSGEAIAQVPLALRKTDGPAAVPYLASIQSGALPGGDYQVVERLTEGGKTSEQSVSFRIEGGEAEEAANPTGKGAAGEDSEPDTASGLQIPPSDANEPRLVITALPADTVPPPTAEQLDDMIAAARKRALDYSKTLPNFVCVEMTNRSADSSGKGNWKHRDSIAELLTYHDNAESRTTLEVNGRRSTLKRADLNSTWPLSVGEFGAILNLVFQPSSKTEFAWKESASLGGGNTTVQVLSYRVARKNATIVLTQGNADVAVGFHGLVYIDRATNGVRRVTLEADDVPKSFPVRASVMTVDYDYIAISDRDYLLPVRSSVMLERAHRKTELNEITFRNYHRYASRAKIKMMQ